MASILIVTDEDQDWKNYFPSDQVVTVEQYLEDTSLSNERRYQVINLCRRYDYMSSGYYCSLMAEARGHNVIPNVMTINDLNQPFVSYWPQSDFEACEVVGNTIEAKVFFGHSAHRGFDKVARKVFALFMIPVIEVRFHLQQNGQWHLESITPLPFQDLNDEEQTLFAKALESFSHKVWRTRKQSKRYRYDLALLVDDNEKMPPSDKAALKRFRKAAQRLSINMTPIGPGDIARLGEFDGLFIRATTNISNFTYQFAKAAQDLGLVVMDDPESIMKCTNKVFLTELLTRNKVSIPPSVILRKGNQRALSQAIQEIGFPMVLKVPDGAFSVGVVKVTDEQSLNEKADIIFDKSALILAQAYMPTDYDWRIGVLNRQPIFACQYMMSRGHWQIYQHHDSGRVSSGGFTTLDIKQAPKHVVDVAVRAANLIGNGLYGVDVKEVDGKAYVIEVNDNPSIDHHVEDAFLGDLLYERIITEFLRRIQLRGF